MFVDGFMRVSLEDVCTKGSSNLKQSDVIDKNGEYEIYGASGLIGKVDFFHQEKPYIAVVKDGAGIGRTMLLPEKSSVIGTMQYILPNEKVTPKYLYYVIRYMHLEKYFTGATIPHIYFKDYRKEEFNLCDLSEQEKITSTLSKIETIITHIRTQLEKLDLLVKARFVEMFENIENMCTIADACSIITDGTHQPPKFTTDGIPFLFVSNIATNEIVYNAEKFISEETYNDLYKRTPIEIGDIILSTVGSYGHPAIVKTNKKFLFQRHIAYLKPIPTTINSIYLHRAILSDNVQRQIDERVKGIAQKTLNLSEIRKIVIPAPPLELQTQFANFVKQVDQSKSILQQELTQTQTLFDSLMQEYFG